MVWAPSKNSVVGPRASGFSLGKDGEAGDIGFIVDGAGCSQAGKGPLEARATFSTEPNVFPMINHESPPFGILTGKAGDLTTRRKAK